MIIHFSVLYERNKQNDYADRSTGCKSDKPNGCLMDEDAQYIIHSQIRVFPCIQTVLYQRIEVVFIKEIAKYPSEYEDGDTKQYQEH